MAATVDRTGAQRQTLQGLTTRVVKYLNRDNVKVYVLETGELIWTDWNTFNKGLVRADLSKLHSHSDCTFRQAKFFIVSITLLILAFIGILAYFLAK